MIFQLIATFMIGVLAASVSYMAYAMSRGKISKVIIPFAAALAMIGYSIWNEMTWLKRTVALLPKEIVLAGEGPPVVSPLSPWTYLYPRTDSFFAVDTRTVQPLPNQSGRYLAQVHDLGRYQAGRKSSWIVDCSTGQHAEILASTKFDDKGMPTDVAWSKPDQKLWIATAVCQWVRAPAPNN